MENKESKKVEAIAYAIPIAFNMVSILFTITGRSLEKMGNPSSPVLTQIGDVLNNIGIAGSMGAFVLAGADYIAARSIEQLESVKNDTSRLMKISLIDVASSIAAYII